MLQPVQSIELSRLPGVRHGFFTREGGVSTGLFAGLNCGPGSSDAPQDVVENRRLVARHLGGQDDVLTAYQVHSPDAVIAEAPFPPEGKPKADAIVTRTPGLVIGVLTADCGPVLLADGEAGVVGAAHAGWRGAVGGVLESAISAMERLGASRARIVAAIGPCINQDSYEVGPDFESALLKSCPSNGKFLSRRDSESKAHFDLPAFIEARLRDAGVARIERQTACTYADDSRFFSFRRSQHRSEPDYGRQISAIVVA